MKTQDARGTKITEWASLSNESVILVGLELAARGDTVYFRGGLKFAT